MEALIVEDDASTREWIRKELAGQGIQALLASDLQSARVHLVSGADFGYVLCDLQLPDGEGEELLSEILVSHPSLPFFAMSAYGTIPRALALVKKGARDFLEKPLGSHALARLRAVAREAPREKVASNPPQGIIHAPGSPLGETVRLARVLATKSCTVLLHGESGTGKEVFARFLHDAGARASEPFVPVNCATISATLLESELFGHCKGSFTGAVADKMGVMEAAGAGTLFLDEVAELPLVLQAKLLRVLQARTVLPVGATRERPVDFRLICASHRDLNQEVAEGRFREDLFFRLNVMQLEIPPLRTRPRDIPFLLKHFLSQQLSPEDAADAMANLPSKVLAHAFPGNIRELRNLAERYAVLHELGLGWEGVLPPMRNSSEDLTKLRLRSSSCSDEQILDSLEICGHHRGKAARRLGITRRALQYRLARLKTPSAPER